MFVTSVRRNKILHYASYAFPPHGLLNTISVGGVDQLIGLFEGLEEDNGANTVLCQYRDCNLKWIHRSSNFSKSFLFQLE